MDTTELITTIRSAFDGIPRSETSLRQFSLTDAFGLTGEVAAQAWKKAGRERRDSTWQEIPDSEIQECGVLLAHMQAREFTYFLPAYMLYSVREFERDSARAETISSVVFSLYPSRGRPNSRAYVLAQLSLLTQPQRKAVVDYLRFVALHGDRFGRPQAAKALERFWSEAIVEHGVRP